MIDLLGRERAELLAEYVIETGATVRRSASHFGISKSTVHKDLTYKLKMINPRLYASVKEILYKNKTGYLYQCNNINHLEQPTQINCAYTCTDPVRIDRVTKIDDLYTYYVEQEKSGLFKIKHFNDIPEKEMAFISEDMKNTVEQYDLRNHPDNPMSVFIKKYFSAVL